MKVTDKFFTSEKRKTWTQKYGTTGFFDFEMFSQSEFHGSKRIILEKNGIKITEVFPYLYKNLKISYFKGRNIFFGESFQDYVELKNDLITVYIKANIFMQNISFLEIEDNLIKNEILFLLQSGKKEITFSTEKDKDFIFYLKNRDNELKKIIPNVGDRCHFDNKFNFDEVIYLGKYYSYSIEFSAVIISEKNLMQNKINDKKLWVEKNPFYRTNDSLHFFLYKHDNVYGLYTCSKLPKLLNLGKSDFSFDLENLEINPETIKIKIKEDLEIDFHPTSSYNLYLSVFSKKEYSEDQLADLKKELFAKRKKVFEHNALSELFCLFTTRFYERDFIFDKNEFYKNTIINHYPKDISSEDFRIRGFYKNFEFGSGDF